MKVKKAKWLVIALTVFMLLSMVPAVGGAVEHEPDVPNYGFIPNSGEASVSKVDLVNKTEVARYYTAPRSDPAPIQWRTSRIAMDADGNAWVLNTGADGTNLQGSVVRILADTEGLTTTATTATPLTFGTDEAVQVLTVGNLGEMPRAIAIDGDGYIWIGFYGSGRLVKYEYNSAGPQLDVVGQWTNVGIGFYEMKLAPNGTLFISSRQSTSAVARPGIVTGIYTFAGGTFVRETTWNPYALLIADDGTVYATAYSNQLWIRDKDTGVWSSKTVGGPQNRGMAFDDLGNIWIASTVSTSSGTIIYSYNIASGAPGPTYTLTSGTTPVGVGKDAAGNMWAICRSDAMAQGWIEGFNPINQATVGAIQVGFRPYAYGDFVVPPLPEYEIAGYKYNDDTDELIADWGVELFKWDPDLGADGEFVLFATTTTGLDGKYSFIGLPAGLYRVVEEQRNGWTAVGPTSYDVTLPGDETLYPVDGDAGPFYNFRNAPLYEIEGFKYRTGTDIPLGGWTIELSKDDDEDFLQTRVTDINGYYKFTGLRAGDYEVTEVQKNGWTQTGPEFGVHLVTLPGENAELTYDFYNEPEMICYDDTIWAYGEGATTNNSVPGNPSNNWGWTNQITEPGEYEFVLYRGAGGNDIEKGTAVGTLFVDYDGTTATITYSVVEPYTLSEVHLWVGKTELPTEIVTRGKTTTTVVSSAPGQLAKLGYSPEISADGLSATITVEIDTPFWVAAHGVVNWCEMVAADEAIYYHWGTGYQYGATVETNAVAMVTTYSIEVWWLQGSQWRHDIYSPVAFTGSTTYTVANLNQPLKAIHETHFPGLVTTNYTRTNIDVTEVPVPNAGSILIPPLPTP